MAQEKGPKESDVKGVQDAQKQVPGAALQKVDQQEPTAGPQKGTQVGILANGQPPVVLHQHQPVLPQGAPQFPQQVAPGQPQPQAQQQVQAQQQAQAQAQAQQQQQQQQQAQQQQQQQAQQQQAQQQAQQQQQQQMQQHQQQQLQQQQAMGAHQIHAFPHGDPHSGLFYAPPGSGFVPQYFYEYSAGFGDPAMGRLPHEQWEDYLRMTGGNVAAINGAAVMAGGLDTPEAAAAAAAAAAAQHQAAFGFLPGGAVAAGGGTPGVPQNAAAAAAAANAAAFMPYGAAPAGSPPLPLNGQMYAPHAFQFQPPIFPPPVPPPPADPSKMSTPEQQRGPAGSATVQGRAVRPQGAATGSPVQPVAGVPAGGSPGAQMPGGQRAPGVGAPGGLAGGGAPPPGAGMAPMQGLVPGQGGYNASGGPSVPGAGRGFHGGRGRGEGRGGRGWGQSNGGKARGGGVPGQGPGPNGMAQGPHGGAPHQQQQGAPQGQQQQGHLLPHQLQQQHLHMQQMHPNHPLNLQSNGQYPPLMANGFHPDASNEQNRGPRTNRGRSSGSNSGSNQGTPGSAGATNPGGQGPAGQQGGKSGQAEKQMNGSPGMHMGMPPMGAMLPYGGHISGGMHAMPGARMPGGVPPGSIMGHPVGAGVMPALLPDPRNYNVPDFRVSYDSARFFVIKSYSEDDVHKSIKYSVWSSTPHGNKRLDGAFKESVARATAAGGGASVGGPAGPGPNTTLAGAKCPVFLFFSVNASGQFCGVAEMLSTVDFNRSVDYWQQDKWVGQFKVKWHMIKDVPNLHFRHITIPANENKAVTNSRDTQEVPLEQGQEMLRIFKGYQARTSILDDFGFYDSRQNALLEHKARRMLHQGQGHHMVGGGGRHHYPHQQQHHRGGGRNRGNNRPGGVMHLSPHAAHFGNPHVPGVPPNGVPFQASTAPLLPKTSASLIENSTPELSPVSTPPPAEGNSVPPAASVAAAAAAVAAGNAAGTGLGNPGTVVAPGLNPAGFPVLAAPADAASPALGMVKSASKEGPGSQAAVPGKTEMVEAPLGIADSLAEMHIGTEEVAVQPQA